MIKHIVMWRVKAVDGGSKEATARAIKSRIDAVQGRIPGLLRIEGGVDFNHGEPACDVVLYSEFESRAALDGYQVHAVHKELAAFIDARQTERRVVDYET